MSDGSIGVYGKVSTQGDFLRAGTADFARAGVDLWLEESMGVLKTERALLPEGAVGLLLAPPSAARAFLGAFAPSEDSVGRQFPLLVFLELSSSAVAAALPFAATAFAPDFVRAAGELALAGRGLAAADLLAQLRELAAPAAPAPLRGDESVAFAEAPTTSLRDALGGGPAALAYALRTFCLACDQAAKAEASSTGLTVDAPAPSSVVRAMWLELAGRRFRRAGSASPRALLWNDGPAARLLVALGTPTSSMLAFWANPRHRSNRLWPLRTDVATAAAAALAALTPGQRRVVEDPGASLGALVGEFG
ncbi:MAG: hypothetical protein JWM82_206 [Myxococcales bacterium]|nr:hypothetical protein [Myxococcales bacterium]